MTLLNKWTSEAKFPTLIKAFKLSSSPIIKINRLEVDNYFKPSFKELKPKMSLSSKPAFHETDSESTTDDDNSKKKKKIHPDVVTSMPELENDLIVDSNVLPVQQNSVAPINFIFAPSENPLYGSSGQVKKERAKPKPRRAFVETGSQYKKDTQKFCDDCLSGKTLKLTQQMLETLLTNEDTINGKKVPLNGSEITEILKPKPNVQMGQIQLTRLQCPERPVPGLLPICNGSEQNYIEEESAAVGNYQISMAQINFMQYPVAFPNNFNVSPNVNLYNVDPPNVYTERTEEELNAGMQKDDSGSATEEMPIDTILNEETTQEEVPENKCLEKICDKHDPKCKTDQEVPDDDTLEIHFDEEFGKNIPEPECGPIKPKKPKLDPLHRNSTVVNEEYEHEAHNSERFRRKVVENKIPNLIKVNRNRVSEARTAFQDRNVNNFVPNPSTPSVCSRNIKINIPNPSARNNATSSNINSSQLQENTPTVYQNFNNHQRSQFNAHNFKVHSSMLQPNRTQRVPQHQPQINNHQQNQSGPRKMVININQSGKRNINLT